jgi:hypothetical protein
MLQVVETIRASDPPFTKLVKAQQKVVLEISTALVAVLGALAIARDEILESIVANGSILRFLFVLASDVATPADLLDDVLSDLLIISEDNLRFGQAAVDDQEVRVYDRLLKLIEGKGMKAVLACGILHNLFQSLLWHDYSRGKDGASDAILIPSLTRVLEQTPLDDTTESNGHGSSSEDVLQTAVEVLAAIGTDLQAMLEKGGEGTGKVAGAEEEWTGFDDADVDLDEDEPIDGDDKTKSQDEEDEEDEEEDYEMDQDEMEADMEMVTGADDEVDGDSDLNDLPTVKELLHRAVPQLIRWAQISPKNDEEVAVQKHALSALNNIAWTISCFDFTNGSNGGIYQAWTPVAKKIWLKTVTPILASDTADVSLATVVTSLAWATARSLGGETPLSGDEHRRFMTLYQASKGIDQQDTTAQSKDVSQNESPDPFQSLGVRCLGVLGQLARDPAPIDLNRDIGVFLIGILKALPATPPADAVEALNQLFDIYGDENFDCDKEVFWKDNFLQHLDELSPGIKSMVKSIDKRNLAELRLRADEAVLNLARFIKYKRKHAP